MHFFFLLERKEKRNTRLTSRTLAPRFAQQSSGVPLHARGMLRASKRTPELYHNARRGHTITHARDSTLGRHEGKEEEREMRKNQKGRPPPPGGSVANPYGHIQRGEAYVSLCFSSAEQQNSKQRTPPRFSQTARGSIRFRHQLELLHSSFCLLFPVFFFAFLQGKFRWWGTRLQNKRYSQLAPKTCV